MIAGGFDSGGVQPAFHPIGKSWNRGRTRKQYRNTRQSAQTQGLGMRHLKHVFPPDETLTCAAHNAFGSHTCAHARTHAHARVRSATAWSSWHQCAWLIVISPDKSRRAQDLGTLRPRALFSEAKEKKERAQAQEVACDSVQGLPALSLRARSWACL